MSHANGTAAAARSMVLPLALAQFIASYAATNMNVAITAIADDIGTTVTGIQTTITLFTLTMASLMIVGSKMTGILGRKACFRIGLLVYGAGAVLAAVSQGLGLMIVGYSLLEGIGSALMIPPIYILITVAFDDVTSRAKYFGVVSGAAGLGAAAGPLIGGLITSTISWRASFIAQALVVAWIIFLSRKIVDPQPVERGARPGFDLTGAILSAAGLFFVVFGILLSGTYGWGSAKEDFAIGGTVLIPKGGISPVWPALAVGALILLWFFLHIRSRERAGGEPLMSPGLFRSRTSNLGLVTQNIQWLTMQGSFFVISVFLQQVWGYNAIQTGLMLTPATLGVLAASAAAERFARRHSQQWLIRVGFVFMSTGMVLLLLLARDGGSIIGFVPGLLLMGVGIGTMLTSSVNVVQSAFPEEEQEDISGLSRSVSNLGSSLGVALAGSVIAAVEYPGGRPFATALIILVVITLIGLVAALFLPGQQRQETAREAPSEPPAR
ncbi:MFS transporter [Planobispora takensis]|uniref:MFS transporter n=1 Tax=Planobispora takensis TaxID=1367882 RepID=A0A8J3SZI5_9ACTN|nr:MFS transporter [Planobispora takensis]GIH98368.1 MFS transporter [Planobispora takensis]